MDSEPASLRTEIVELQKDLELALHDCEQHMLRISALKASNEELLSINRRFQANTEKNKEVIKQLTEKIKYAEQQLRDVLANMLHTEDI